MALVHQLSEQLYIASLEGADGVDGTLAFGHHMRGTLQGDGVVDCPLDLLELACTQLGEVLQGGAYRAQLPDGQLALGHTVVVGTGVELVWGMRIGDDQLDTVHPKWHILELERAAVEIDGVVFLAIGRCELIHDAAVDTGKLVFALLPYLCQPGLVAPGRKNIVEGKGRNHLDGRRRAEACSSRHIAPEEEVVALP